MPDYRFRDPVRQVSLVDFGLLFGEVCMHLKVWGFTVTDVRLRAGRLTFTTLATQVIPVDQLDHLDLELG